MTSRPCIRSMDEECQAESGESNSALRYRPRLSRSAVGTASSVPSMRMTSYLAMTSRGALNFETRYRASLRDHILKP